jgi:PAS domain S-box-containing protein
MLIKNSIQILAVTLEHLDYELTLENERNDYETKANKSLEELKKTVKDLQDSRTASINLIEDLSDEVEKRRETEKELLLKNLVFDESIAANSIADKSGILRQANTSFIKTWGYNSKEEVIGRSITEFIRDKNEVKEIFRSLDDTGQWNGEYTALKRDGSTFYANGLATVIRNIDGEMIGYQSSVQDITDRKKTEEALRENEERFRHLFEDGQFCMAMVDRNFRFLHTNEAFCRMLGYSEAEMQSFTFKDITHPDHMERDLENMSKLYTGSIGVYQTEKRYIRKDKSIVWGLVNVSAIRDKPGNFLYFLAMIDDISERKIAEEKLFESEEHFRKLFENMLNGFAYCKMIYEDAKLPDFKYVNVNEAFETLTGLKNVEGKRVSEVIPGIQEADPVLLERYGRVARTGKPEMFEVYVESLKMWFSISVYSPKKEYFVAVFDVITERKKSEEALRESEDKFKYIFDHSALGNSITHPAGKTHFNDSFCSMLGYSAEELEQLRWQDFTHPDDFEITQKVLDTLISRESDSPRFVKRYIRKDRSVMWADVSTSLRYDKDDKPLYFMTTINDITELKLAEEVLRNDEKRFRELIEALPQLYLTCRVDGPCDYLSKQWIEYTGISESEQLGYGWLDQIHPEDREKTVSDWNDKVKNGIIFENEFRIRKYDGEYHWFRTRAVPIRDSEKNIIRWLGSNTDIDNIKKAEDQLKNYNKDLEQRVIDRTEQLLAANRELEAFSYSVSHDLRAPMRAIHSFTSILREDYGKVLDDEGNRICSIIEKSSVHMGQLIDDLLAFSRIGRTGLDHVAIDMESLAKSIYSELTTPEEQKRIIFTIEKLQAASGDAVLMRQVITNLLSNALKYSSKNENAKIVFGSEKKDGEVVYFIKDNGVGFDMQYSNKLFGVFQRLHSAKEFEGNGVGLAIVQRIILRHDGRVWAESEKGNGATFYFSLPVNKIK